MWPLPQNPVLLLFWSDWFRDDHMSQANAGRFISKISVDIIVKRNYHHVSKWVGYNLEPNCSHLPLFITFYLRTVKPIERTENRQPSVRKLLFYTHTHTHTLSLSLSHTHTHTHTQIKLDLISIWCFGPFPWKYWRKREMYNILFFFFFVFWFHLSNHSLIFFFSFLHKHLISWWP